MPVPNVAGPRMTISTAAAACGLILFPLAMIYAGLMDLATLTIRNTLVAGLACAWLVLAPLAGFTFAELGTSAALAGAILAVTFTLFTLGWIGGGDAKLAAVTALWFQPQEVFLFFAYTSVLGGILTLAILQLRASTIPMFLYRVPWIAQLHDRVPACPTAPPWRLRRFLSFPIPAGWCTRSPEEFARRESFSRLDFVNHAQAGARALGNPLKNQSLTIL